jgi:hypothetical protein
MYAATMTRSTKSDDDQPLPDGSQAPADSQPGDTRAANSGSVLQDVASTIVGAAGPVLSAARRPVDQLASGARRILDESSGSRVRRVRRMGRQPLVNLWEAHPEARRVPMRELGLQTVAVSDIAGTAVEGPAQRGGDFLPLRDRRSGDWRARWQRITRAVENLVSLPPFELLRFADRYWVVDGHNRVAAALYSGQEAIDAVVYELRLPGSSAGRDRRAIAPYLEGSRDLRAAGSGRLARTAAIPDPLLTASAPANDHGGRAEATDDESSTTEPDAPASDEPRSGDRDQ